MAVGAITPRALADLFRASMRIAPAGVSLVTARAADGGFHGMAVTSATSLSMSPPSMLVAINRSASVHPIISSSRRFCLNLMGEPHGAILECFSRSDMRATRFTSEHWREGPGGLPLLKGALSSHICDVEAAHDYGTHTIFVGRVNDVVLPEISARNLSPLIWLNGSHASLAASCET
jgi:flavin reductase (DIM6/NTAB) family NADH-FMN oxidoreductase RutF